MSEHITPSVIATQAEDLCRDEVRSRRLSDRMAMRQWKEDRKGENEQPVRSRH